MESKDELKKYLRVPKGQIILSAIFAVLLVFCLVMTIVKGSDNKIEATLFDPIVSQEGEYVYMDAAQTDGWIYDDGKGNIYYSVVDYYGYYNNVILNNSKNKKIEKAAKNGETYRIYGTVEKPSFSVINAYCEVYSIETGDYYDYFGDMVFNGLVTPNSDTRDTWMAFTLLAIILGSIFFSMLFSTLKKLRLSIKGLDNRNEIQKAGEELDKYFLDNENKGFALTDNFIYANPNLYNYEDLIWAYVRITRYNFVKVNSELVLNTMKGKNIEIPCGKEEVANEILCQLKEKNENLLIGFTKENKNAYKEIRKNGK